MTPSGSAVVALVPARAGSRRIPGKNVRTLRGHPLIAYTIAAALDSGVFQAVVVSTDSADIAAAARHYGAEVPFLRPAAMAGDLSADIEWVTFTMGALAEAGRSYGAFSILRPTSPLRQAATIRRAWSELVADPEADSLRAVEPCTQHPAKMWVLEGTRMRPLLGGSSDTPTHSRPCQSLPPVFVQNASLELARSRVLDHPATISGSTVRPFHCEGHQGFDLNDERDWWVLERLLDDGVAQLPETGVPPFPASPGLATAEAAPGGRAP